MPLISQPRASPGQGVAILANEPCQRVLSTHHGLDRNRLNRLPFILPDFPSVTIQTVLRFLRLNLPHKTGVVHIQEDTTAAAVHWAQRLCPAPTPWQGAKYGSHVVPTRPAPSPPSLRACLSLVLAGTAYESNPPWGLNKTSFTTHAIIKHAIYISRCKNLSCKSLWPEVTERTSETWLHCLLTVNTFGLVGFSPTPHCRGLMRHIWNPGSLLRACHGRVKPWRRSTIGCVFVACTSREDDWNPRVPLLGREDHWVT